MKILLGSVDYVGVVEVIWDLGLDVDASVVVNFAV